MNQQRAIFSDDDRRQSRAGRARAAPSLDGQHGFVRSTRRFIARHACADRRHERIDDPLRSLCAASVASHAVGDNKQARLSMVAVLVFGSA